MELGARRIDFIGLKFQLSDEMRDLYAQAYAQQHDHSKDSATAQPARQHQQHERPLPGSPRRLLPAQKPLPRKLASREPPLLDRQRPRPLRPADATLAEARRGHRHPHRQLLHHPRTFRPQPRSESPHPLRRQNRCRTRRLREDHLYPPRRQLFMDRLRQIRICNQTMDRR